VVVVVVVETGEEINGAQLGFEFRQMGEWRRKDAGKWDCSCDLILILFSITQSRLTDWDLGGRSR